MPKAIKDIFTPFTAVFADSAGDNALDTVEALNVWYHSTEDLKNGTYDIVLKTRTVQGRPLKASWEEVIAYIGDAQDKGELVDLTQFAETRQFPDGQPGARPKGFSAA